MWRDMAQRKSSDHDGKENGENLSRVFNLAADEESRPLPKSKTVVQVDDGHHGGEHGAQNHLQFASPFFGFNEMGVILSSEFLLCVEGGCISN